MGYYIQTSESKQKAAEIVYKYGGRFVTEGEARLKLGNLDKSNMEFAVIVVVDNGPFEAAGFAYDMKEFEAFANPCDIRKKQFVIIDRAKAKELTGYKGA